MTVIVAVTGAHGFVGRALCQHLKACGFSVRAITRSASGEEDTWAVGDLGPGTDWGQSLQGVDCVVHCAARVHMVQDTDPDPLQSYRRVNVEGSRSLAVAAAAAGVRRLVFLSSLKVHGEHTAPGHPFTSGMAPAPDEEARSLRDKANVALGFSALQSGQPDLARRSLQRVRLELARCPEFPQGSHERGYDFIAPLDAAGHIDAEGWKLLRDCCRVKRF